MSKKKLMIAFVAAIALCANSIYAHIQIADAYALPPNSSSTGETTNTLPSFNWTNIMSSFQSLFRGVNAIWLGTGAFPYDPAAAWNSQNTANGAETAVQGFDTWFYSISGFHIANFLIAILTILSWILGAVKGAVDWLIAIL